MIDQRTLVMLADGSGIGHRARLTDERSQRWGRSVSRRRFKLSRQDERSTIGDDDGVLNMRRHGTVSGFDRPPVAALANRAATSRDDRLDRDHQTIGQLLGIARHVGVGTCGSSWMRRPMP
jgi:hypothetical protein